MLLTSVGITTDTDSLQYHDHDHIYVFSFVNFNQCYKIQINHVLPFHILNLHHRNPVSFHNIYIYTYLKVNVKLVILNGLDVLAPGKLLLTSTVM